MTIIIDGKNAVLGRIASFAAKKALGGEEVAVLNCEEVIISGNRKDIQKKYKEKRDKVGSGQKGPKISRTSEQIVRRAIRGMLPHASRGRGKEAFKKIKCYKGTPKEFEDSKKINLEGKIRMKFIRVKEVYTE
ncbi:MAG TPA: 50S ribosomal protein L13 [Candidatus Nanoarchaeia archaeon]|nr:50S ribosomal protein L13 [Candidatus Nanoarchaeia archaeon]